MGLLRLERGPSRRDEAGIAAVFVVFVAVALLAVAGLVIDGGYTMAAKREATGQAESAARVGADALNEASLRTGSPVVDPQLAVTAAQAYLARVDATGTVSVDGATVTVTVAADQPMAVLSAVGVSSLHVSATASARSIDQDEA
jgi:Flp pilus assembly protein TadG